MKNDVMPSTKKNLSLWVGFVSYKYVRYVEIQDRYFFRVMIQSLKQEQLAIIK